MQTNLTRLTSMKIRYMAFTAAAVVLIAGCSQTGDATDVHASPKKQLEKYRNERAALDVKIKALEASLGKQGNSGGVVPVTIVTTVEAPFKHVIVVKGTVDSRSSVAVAPKSSGQLISLHVANGTVVKKGDLLAELDADILLKGIDELKTQLDFATTLYEKQQRIYDQKAGSEIQFLQAKNNKEALEKRLASLQEQLTLTRIKAPTSGYVDGLVPIAGEMVAAGIPILTIVNTADMRVVADLAETYVATVSVGAPANVVFGELGDSTRSKVTGVAQSINPINRTFRVEIPIRPVPPRLRPNSTCDVAINDITLPKAIAIPMEALMRLEDKAYVYVIENNVARKREIQTGLVNGAMVQVVSGIGANEQVVVRGAMALSDGQKVQIVQ